MKPHYPMILRMEDFRPLGPALKKPEPKKPDPVSDFERLKHEAPPSEKQKPVSFEVLNWPELTKGGGKTFHERKAERVNGAAPAREQQKPTHSELVAPAPVAAPPSSARQFKVGDRVQTKDGSLRDLVVLEIRQGGDVVCISNSGWTKNLTGTFRPESLGLIEPASPPPSTGVLEPEVGKVYLTKQRADATEFEYFNYFSADGWLSGGMNANLACRRDHSPRAEVQDRIVIRPATPEELGA